MVEIQQKVPEALVRERLTVAKATLERFVERATRLYEQGPGEPEGSHRLGTYVRRWAQWVRAGLGAPLRSAHGAANEPAPTSGHRSLARLWLRLTTADHLGVPDRPRPHRRVTKDVRSGTSSVVQQRTTGTRTNVPQREERRNRVAAAAVHLGPTCPMSSMNPHAGRQHATRA